MDVTSSHLIQRRKDELGLRSDQAVAAAIMELYGGYISNVAPQRWRGGTPPEEQYHEAIASWLGISLKAFEDAVAAQRRKNAAEKRAKAAQLAAEMAAFDEAMAPPENDSPRRRTAPRRS